MQVYRIFNKANGKSYIGITKWTFKERYNHGKWWKWTHSVHLKSSVKRYGLSSFDHEILWEGEVAFEELINMEKLYIKQYNSFMPNGYNLTKGGSQANPTFIKHYELIDFNGNLYKIHNLREFCRKNKLNYSAMLNMTSGINTSSQGYALSITDLDKVTNPKEQWVVENVNTLETDIILRGKVRAWARKKKLDPDSIENIIHGEVKVSQGWKLKDTILDKNYRIGLKYQDTRFINPNGKIQVIKNIYKFCEENGLNRSRFYDLITGKSLEYEGWTLPYKKKDLQRKKALRLGKEVKLISPDNQEITVKNISLFCRDQGFNRNSIGAMLEGRTKQYKGWKLKR